VINYSPNNQPYPRTCYAGEAERTGYGCSHKVSDSGYIPSVPPQGAGVCTLRNESKSGLFVSELPGNGCPSWQLRNKMRRSRQVQVKFSKQLRIDLTGYVFILPNILGMVTFILIPIVFSLIVSFTDWDFTQGFGNWNFIGLRNFISMWSDTWFTSALVHTIIFAFVSVPLIIAISLVLAIIIDKSCFAKTPIRLAMFMPYISNIVAVSIVWVMMYSPWGPFTQLVKFFGVENPPKWLSDYQWAFPAIIIMTIWMNIGYCVMIYTSSIQGLSEDLYEAADIDGAGELSKFWNLTVPSLSPTTFFLVITQFISAFQIFAQVQVMTRGGPGTSTNVLVYYIYTSAFTFYKMGYSAAMSWVLFFILFFITLVQWQGQKKWTNY
jgi:multiple sugar transport system permease protein